MFYKAVLLAILIEALIETFKWARDKELSGWRIVAMVAGILITPLTKVDIFQAVGLPLVIPFIPEQLGQAIGGAIGWILTGLVVCRGSTVIHDLYKTMADLKELVGKLIPSITPKE